VSLSSLGLWARWFVKLDEELYVELDVEVSSNLDGVVSSEPRSITYPSIS
jgi:hypothetical protein